MSDVVVRTVVNGRAVECAVPPRLTLVELLRERLGLTGAKPSCGMQVCGTCTVLVDARPVSSCTYLACDVEGREVLTVEGLADGARLHPLQGAFADRTALQCGYCTPGFVMAAKALLDENPDPTEGEVVHYLDGNICRCTGYKPIVAAVLEAARRLREGRRDDGDG